MKINGRFVLIFPKAHPSPAQQNKYKGRLVNLLLFFSSLLFFPLSPSSPSYLDSACGFSAGFGDVVGAIWAGEGGGGGEGGS